MNIVISRWGSSGDVLPYIAIGWELRRRGYSVTFVGNPYFAARATEAGLSFASVGAVTDHEALMADADIFDRAKKSGEQIYAEHYGPHLENFYRTILDACDPTSTVIVGGEAPAAMVAEKFRLPLVSVACSPTTSSFTRSQYDPPHPERLLPGWARWFARTGKRLSLLYRLNTLRHGIAKRPRLGPFRLPDEHPIARLRSHVGVPPVSQFRPQLVVCMWPDWFAPPQPDWPEYVTVAGFPFYPQPTYGRHNGSRSSSEASGLRPIVVTTGSLAGSQPYVYASAIAACKALGRSAILVTPHRNQIPKELPLGISHVEYAPFHDLLGRGSLLIHHGGIGTASYALAAGIPQIVMPLRGDHFDNGNRLVRLGVARMLSAKDTRSAQLARMIEFMLSSTHVAGRCGYWQSRIDPEEGLRRAADCIEMLMSSRGQRE